MVNYSQTVIYRIQCKDKFIKDVYIGSTCNFAHRKYEHKSQCNGIGRPKIYKRLLYTFIRCCGGWDNWEMVPIKLVNCNSKMEKLIIEREQIENNGYATLNQQLPGRNKKEWGETTTVCQCGATIRNGSRWYHLKSVAHKKVMSI